LNSNCRCGPRPARRSYNDDDLARPRENVPEQFYDFFTPTKDK